MQMSPSTDKSYSRAICYSRSFRLSKRQGSHEREITEAARVITLGTLALPTYTFFSFLLFLGLQWLVFRS
jgi:hypothetical protein